MKKIHEFENGVRVYEDQILELQKRRYLKRNVHEEEEEDLFIKVVRQLRPNAIYVNIGSAIGYYPLLAKSLRHDLLIHCYEPLSAHIEMFKKNIKLNGLNINDFNIHNIAISNISGTVSVQNKSYASKVVTSEDAPNLMSIIMKIARMIIGAKAKYFYCKSISLNEVFSEINCAEIDLVQMDIQGHEIEVLRHFFNSYATGNIKSFIIGTHGNKIHEECYYLFKENNYKFLFDLKNPLTQPDGILYCELA